MALWPGYSTVRYGLARIPENIPILLEIPLEAGQRRSLQVSICHVVVKDMRGAESLDYHPPIQLILTPLFRVGNHYAANKPFSSLLRGIY